MPDSGSTPPTTSPIDERFAPGRLLGERYRIVGRLGRGGMGEVFRADDLTLGQSVALKFLPEELQDRPELQERLLAEVRLARQVAHPNICSVYDVGQHDGRFFLTMEYIDGEDLDALLRRIGRLSDDKALQIARQLCAGLAAVHDKGIVHCDLKPGNVMIDGRGNVRIADFGLAGVIDDDNAVGVGTPAYLAPELTRGQKPSARSDVYALGLVLFELFSGQRAFEAESIAEFVQLHREQAPPRLSNVTPNADLDIERAIDACLAKDPERRPTSAFAVAAALPGGDPLADALAAGQTPSPEMVAAAGGAGGLSKPLGLTLWLAAIAGFVTLCALAPQSRLSGFFSLAQSPEVLAHRAGEILEALEWTYDTPYSAGRFERNGSYLHDVDRSTTGPDRWEVLRDDKPPAYLYWHRRSVYPIYSRNPSWTVTSTNPPLTDVRTVDLYLGPTGKLEGLDAFLGTVVNLPEYTFANDKWEAEQSYTPDELPWRTLFELAGLPPERFKPVRPQRLAQVPFNMRLAWLGSLAERPDDEIRVEAAFLYKRPVYFRTFPAPPATVREIANRTLLEFGETMRFGLYIVLLIAGVLFWRHNVRLGRGDRRGAFRLALFVVAVELLTWSLRTRWPYTFQQQFWFFTEAAGNAIFVAGFLGFLYFGLEPQVRRVWPDRMIGWSRLLAGRWTDPRVGREVLLGVSLIVVASLAEPLGYLLVSSSAADAPAPYGIDFDPLCGTRPLLKDLVSELRHGLEFGLGAIFILVILLTVLRRRTPALIGFVVVALLASPRQGETGMLAVDLAASAAIIGAALLLILRGGLLALSIAGLLCDTLLGDWPLTTDWSAWHGTATVVVALLIVGMATFGYVTACARPQARAGHPAQ